MSVLTNIEQTEIKRIVSYKVGATYVSTQQDMEYLLSKYIRYHKGVSVRIETLKGMDEHMLSLFPDMGINELQKLAHMYDVAHKWFLDNREWYTNS